MKLAIYLQLLILIAHLFCPCVASNRNRRAPKLELSGWRSVGAKDSDLESPQVVQHQSVAARNANNSKLIEWDDDENLASDFNDSNKSADVLYLLTYQDENNVAPTPEIVTRPTPSTTTTTSTTTSTTTTAPSIAFRLPEEAEFKALTWKAIGKRPPVEEKQEFAKFWWNSVDSSKAKKPLRFNEISKLKLTSNWKPIANDQKDSSVATRGRRASGKAKPTASPKPEISSGDMDIVVRPGFHWKPMSSVLDEDTKQHPVAGRKVELPVEVNITSAALLNETIIYGSHHPTVFETQRPPQSSIDEPFDDDGVIVAVRADRTNETMLKEPRWNITEKVSDLGQTNKVSQHANNRWVPIEQNNSSLVGSNSTNEQKSASDLNYIYSSQPGSSYGYAIQQQQQQPVSQEQPGTIIDTSSGQVPEMVMLDQRTPEVVQAVQQQPQQDVYQPQSAYVSQPYKQPTMSQPLSESYYPYRTSQPQLQLQQQQLTPPPARQLVREEHHHHYYNQQARQNQQQQSGVSEPTRSSIIREIQPLLITQPIFQQPAAGVSTTTAAPQAQIIREIIKEVPVQSMSFPALQAPATTIQLPRAIQLPAPAIPVALGAPEIPLVNFVQQPSNSAAQQIFRQISNNMPSVRVQIPQIRFSLPSLQLPTRLGTVTPVGNQAAVTRQTGSFVIPPMPKKTTTYLTQTQVVPTHTTIMHTTQFTPATRTTVYTTEHQAPQTMSAAASVPAYKRR